MRCEVRPDCPPLRFEQDASDRRLRVGGTWRIVAPVYGLVKRFTSNGEISGLGGDYKHRLTQRDPAYGRNQNGDEAGLRPAPPAELLSDYDYGKGTGLHFAATLAWGWRLKLGAGQKDLVGF